MKEVSNPTLNKKLAEWSGFYTHSHMGQTDIDREEYQETVTNPNGKVIRRYPNFTNSLDTCFEWLWDKTVQELADIDLSSIEEAVHKLFQLWATEWVTDLQINLHLE